MKRARDYIDAEGKWRKEYAIAPRFTPTWLKVRGQQEWFPVIGFDNKVAGYHFEEGEEPDVVEIAFPPLDTEEFSRLTGSHDVAKLEKQWRNKLVNPDQVLKGYKKREAYESEQWRTLLQAIGVRHDGSSVGWYDLDEGFVRYATLWDLAHLKQGMLITDLDENRPLWLLSEKQWDEAEFPPPIKGGPPFVKGITAAAEAGRMQTMRISEAEARKILERLHRRGSRVSLEEFHRGINIELEEHADIVHGDEMKAGKIALAHLKEDPRYYTKLKRVGLEANDYPDMEAALLGAQSRFDATHATRGHNATIFSPSSRGYVKRVGFREKGFYHWPEKGAVVSDLPSSAEMIHELIDTGWDPEVAPTAPASMRRAAEGRTRSIPSWESRGERDDLITAFFTEHQGQSRGFVARGLTLYGTEDETETPGYVIRGISEADVIAKAKKRWPRARHVKRPPDEWLESFGAHSREESRENPVDTGDGVPWVKIARDPEQYKAAMKEADEIGPIDDPKKVYELLGPALLKEDQEVFAVVLLDVRQQCRGVAEVHRGSRSRVATSMVDILRVVLKSGAEGFVVVHNHPTGKASPSPADKDLTKAIEKAAKLFDGDLAFVDHVICGNGQYYSFADEKLYKLKKSGRKAA